ncbi:MAG: hypothetical protein ACYC4E_02405, partial [Carboxydocellales bacterium]
TGHDSDIPEWMDWDQDGTVDNLQDDTDTFDQNGDNVADWLQDDTADEWENNDETGWDWVGGGSGDSGGGDDGGSYDDDGGSNSQGPTIGQRKIVYNTTAKSVALKSRSSASTGYKSTQEKTPTIPQYNPNIQSFNKKTNKRTGETTIAVTQAGTVAGSNSGTVVLFSKNNRKTGKTPPSAWPPLPENLGGKKPKWNKEGYWEGKEGDLTWDSRSHGSGVDRGDGAQDGHWDDEKSDRRWRRDGTVLPITPDTSSYPFDIVYNEDGTLDIYPKGTMVGSTINPLNPSLPTFSPGYNFVFGW